MTVARSWLPWGAMALSALGALWAALGLLDPSLLSPSLVPLALSGSAVWLAVRLGRRTREAAFLAVLTTLWTASHWVGTSFGADSRAHFAYLRSIAFDGDVELANEREFWGSEADRANPEHPVGPALLWSPFYAAAHGYVLASRALGRTVHEANGFSLPYVRSTAVGTILVGVAGAWLLGCALRRLWDLTTVALAVTGAVLASSTVYYLLVQPAMAHGLAFGLAAALVWAWFEAERDPGRRSWLRIGALLGLLCLTRWQAALFGLLFAPLAFVDLRRRALDWRSLIGAALAAVLAFTPQMLVWMAHFGTPLTVPQGRGFIDWSSPHLVDTLISADRGLFTWTPAIFVGLAGLLGLRERRLFAVGALLVTAATCWLNGGVLRWTGDRAFGARRFDLLVPLVAVGLASVIRSTRAFVARRPLAVPVALLAGLVVWNLGLMRLYRQAVFVRAAPLERLAADQAGQLRGGLESLAAWLGGARAKSLVYKALVGEYFWENVNPGGTIDLGGDQTQYLVSGWSAPKCRDGWPRFRWALHPEACVRVPLAEPFDVRTAILLRAPLRLARQTVAVLANGSPVTEESVPPDWTELRFTIPAGVLVPGENLICLRFGKAPPAEGGERRAAAVARIQLP